MTLNRRNFLFGVAGFGIGGALATATGLGAYYIRRSRKRTKLEYGASLEEWILTEDDHNALAELDSLPESQTLELLDNIDMHGSDYRWERVSGIEDCVAACETDNKCNAFTFARLTHPIEKKRHMCFLKSDRNPGKVVEDFYYISGRRP